MTIDIPQEFSGIILHDTGADDPERILAVGDPGMLTHLNGETWFGDGTFAVVPDVFFQLYTIHTKVGSNYPPIIYFLLPGKTAALYAKMINIIKLLCPTAAPSRILLDFEQAALSSFSAGFPAAAISGCFFHLGQCVQRKVCLGVIFLFCFNYGIGHECSLIVPNSLSQVQAVGLKRRYETEPDFSLLVKSLTALSFIPPAEVEDRYAELAAEFPDEPQCNELLGYFQVR